MDIFLDVYHLINVPEVKFILIFLPETMLTILAWTNKNAATVIKDNYW